MSFKVTKADVATISFLVTFLGFGIFFLADVIQYWSTGYSFVLHQNSTFYGVLDFYASVEFALGAFMLLFPVAAILIAWLVRKPCLAEVPR